MSKEGIHLEICLVAARIFKVDPATVLPEIKRVEKWLDFTDRLSGQGVLAGYRILG